MYIYIHIHTVDICIYIYTYTYIRCMLYVYMYIYLFIIKLCMNILTTLPQKSRLNVGTCVSAMSCDASQALEK